MAALIDAVRAALADRYRIERELGRGGMSTVYLAEDLKHRRRVAIKVLDPEVAEVLGRDRFLREIETTAGINHPHILPLHDSGTAAGLLYYVMPYAAGESLRARLDREQQLPVEEAVRLAREVALALDHAHRHGLVHRDIKPENILLVEDHAVLADLGIARSLAPAELARLTATGAFVGTPQYASPEQLMASSVVDGRGDVYSLSCVLYEMLAGHPPFHGPSPESLAHQHLAVDPPAITGARPAVSETLARAIHRGLAKNPADRYPSAQDFAEALGAVGSMAPAPTPIPAPRGWPLARAVPTIVVAALGVAVWAWVARRGCDRAPPDQTLVAVFPFRVSGSGPGLAYLREGMVDLLAAKLTGEAGPRAIEPRTIFAALPKGSQAADLPETDGLRLARRLGAAHAVFGSVVATTGRLLLSATITSVRTGGTSQTAEAQGPVDSLAHLVDRLTAQILVGATGRSDLEATDLTTQSLPALRAYLEGQSAFRTGAWRDAYNHFERAIELDSTFALAAIGCVKAGAWYLDDASLTEREAGLAWAQRERLGRRDRALLLAYVGPRYPAIASPQELIAASEEAARVAPDRAEAWYRLGEMFFHEGEAVGLPDARRRARAAFRKAFDLDSTFAGPLEHIIDVDLAEGDTTEMRTLSRRYLATQGSAEHADYIRFVVATTLHDEAALAKLRARMPQMHETSLATIRSKRFGMVFDDRERAAEILATRLGNESDRWPDYYAWSKLELDHGRPSRASKVLRAAREVAHISERPDLEQLMQLLFSDGDETVAERAYQRVVAIADAPPALDIKRRGDQDQCIYLAEVWRLYHGDAQGAARTLARLRESPLMGKSLHPGGPFRTTFESNPMSRVLAIEALLASSQRRPDAQQKARALESLLDTHYGFPSAAMILARVYERNGDPKQALAILRRHMDTINDIAHATALHEEGRLAALTGDREGAIRAYRLYLVLRSDPEPERRAEVERVREKLARLVGPVP